jgi:hypothetical protein
VLQRQVSLLSADKEADYYLFDERDEPVRAVLRDIWVKILFRTTRSDAMFGAKPDGLEPMAEYMIKVMGQKPGLSRARILDQFTREYGEDKATKVAEWERQGAKNGYEPGATFMDDGQEFRPQPDVREYTLVRRVMRSARADSSKFTYTVSFPYNFTTYVLLILFACSS